MPWYLQSPFFLSNKFLTDKEVTSKSSTGHLKKKKKKSLKHLYSVYTWTPITKKSISGKCLPNLEWSCRSLPRAHWLRQISQNFSAADQPFNCKTMKSNYFFKYKPKPQFCLIKSFYSSGPWHVRWSSKQSTENHPLMMQCLLYSG